MNKHLLVVIPCLFIGFNAQATEDNIRDKVILSLEAEVMVAECKNENTAEFNRCLKNEITDIINQVFAREEQVYLLQQMNEIEKSVMEAEFNLKDKQVKNLASNIEAANELKLLNLNAIWQKMLNDTINMVSEQKQEI